MKPGNQNSFKCLKEISVNGKNYSYYSLKEAEENGLEGINKLPKSIKVLLENLLRYEDNVTVNKEQILAIKEWLNSKKSKTEIAYTLVPEKSPKNPRTSMRHRGDTEVAKRRLH